MSKLIGNFTIHPLLFITGKVSGYATWIILLSHLLGYQIVPISSPFYLRIFSYSTLFIGSIITFISLINLGKSTSLGIPLEETSLKTNGLYQFSRNPMYVGFNLLTISSIIYTLNPLVIILGLYSIIVYHFIILGEEKFLFKRFKKPYSIYCKNVRRYI